MILNKISLTGLALLAFSFVSLASGAHKAYADISITYSVNVTGMPQTLPRPGYKPPKFPQTITDYYTATRARVQGFSGKITIYDLAGQQTYTLDPATKTYYVQPILAHGRFDMLSLATLTATDETRTIKSVTAMRYTLSGTMTLGNLAAAGVPLPTLSGDIWMSDSAPLPAGATTAVPEASIFGLSGPLFSKALSDAIVVVKRIPISGDVTLSATIPSTDGSDATDLNLVETFYATSVSTNAVSSDLFSPPASYTKIDPPQNEGWGGDGGWGPRSGNFGQGAPATGGN